MGSGLVSLHEKGVILAETFSLSRKQLTWERAVPPDSARSQDVQASEKT